MHRLRAPTPAMVVAVIALFAALAGGAIAAGGDTASDQKIANNATRAYFQRHILSATVKTSNTGARVVRGRGAAGAGRVDTGVYFVSFNRPIASCTWIGTYGSTRDGLSDALTITVEARDLVGSPNDLVVRERDTAGTATDGSGFHIEVVCP